MCDLVHLHVHTEYSLLDGASRIPELMERARSLGMRAIALSDHGNLFAVPSFYTEAEKAGLKPIIGCEFYLVDAETFTKDKTTYHQLLLAKNETGWQNLLYLSSFSFLEGFYYKPRIHKKLLAEHAEGLIATTSCLASEINQKILLNRVDEAEAAFRWYLEVFGEDFYVELQDHGLRDQYATARFLLEWARKYKVPILGTNDVHYTCEADAELHDLLLAVQTGSSYKDPKRLRFTDDKGELNRHFYLKSREEMEAMPLFREHPEALTRTVEVAEKCSLKLDFARPLLLPRYPIPPEYPTMEAYLRALAYEGARQRYGTLTPEIEARLEHELRIIEQMGFAGYFLIVQDFVAEARRRGVWVGPGRGSAAGSLVAYVLRITDVDPIAYQLLFERFLNPERISPPDIDIDFDDIGREEVIRYVQEKYGSQNVAQIITYGTMGIKTAIRDVGRALEVSLSEVNALAGLIPNKPNTTWKDALDPAENPKAHILQQHLAREGSIQKRLLETAARLEGLTRHTGVHAAGVIIAPDALWKYVPLAIATREESARQVITQWDGPDCERVGLLKMDFLGLKTLSILKTALQLIQTLTQQPEPLDLERIPLDDPKTWQLFQEGRTIGLFQFESEGMQKYLKMLRPTCIEDLIAMNALYRPGPMDNIPTFVRRKHGEEPVTYPDPRLRPILENTYGIMVYQEQIMQIAQVMAGYSLAEADLLRRAMGKKKKEIMDEQRAIFIERAIAHGTPPAVAEEVFDTMARFAEYGFNKSHAAAYSILAYRTAYLKAHYPAAYLAAVLTHHADDSEKVGFFLQEVRAWGIQVLPPSVNHSAVSFSVPAAHQIRFGLDGIKHLGTKMAEAIVQERTQNGLFKNVFDFAVRMVPYGLHKKAFESLCLSGALDELVEGGRETLLEEENRRLILDYAANAHKAPALLQGSLFDRVEFTPAPPPALRPPKRRLTQLEQLHQEREYVGYYLSSHPLDDYKEELELLRADPEASRILSAETPEQQCVRWVALLLDADEGRTKTGRAYARLTFEDKFGSYTLSLFSPQWEKYEPLVRGQIGMPFFLELVLVTRPDGGTEWKVRKLEKLPNALQKAIPPSLYLEWDLQRCTPDEVEDFFHLVEKHSGPKEAFLILHYAHQYPVLIGTALKLRYSAELREDLAALGIRLRLEELG